MMRTTAGIAAVALVALCMCTAGAVAASNSDNTFKRERRTAEDAAEALENLRAALTSQNEALFAVEAAVRNTATQADVAGTSERTIFLSSRIDELASAEDVDDMASAVEEAVGGANTATILARQVTESLPPLRSRSEVALGASLSLLQQFAEHDESVSSFETEFRMQSDALRASFSDLRASSSDFYESTNFTSVVNNIVSRADAVIEFVDDIDTDTFNVVLSNMQLTSAYDTSVPVFYWRTWFTYSRYQGWFAGNNANLFGGVNPSEWSDSYGYTYEMSMNIEVLKDFFNRKMTTGYSAHVWSQEWYYCCSTNAQHTGVLFRIRNRTPASISWQVRIYHHNYGSWEEASSAAMNGVNQWTQTNNCGSCTSSITFNVPANGISTIIFHTSSSHPSNTRASGMAFYDDSLRLPGGLEWYDDLPVATNLYQPL